MNKKLKNFISIISIIVVAALGSIFVQLGMDWFNGLNKPSQWIPNIVIPIVWSIIYITFAIVLVLWQNREDLPVKTVILLIVNGVLNILWCLVFFTLKQTFLGNVVIVINAIMAYLLVIDIYKGKALYGYITLIYPIWVTIATTLNTAMWILN